MKQDITAEQQQLDFDRGLRNHKRSGNDMKGENDGMLVLIIGTVKYPTVWSM